MIAKVDYEFVIWWATEDEYSEYAGYYAQMILLKQGMQFFEQEDE